MDELTVRAIGHVRTGMRLKFDAPHQPQDGTEEENIIELLPGHNYERALEDLEGFDRIWLIWWFHRNTTWRPRVLPPRGSAKRRGVFATRSPHRPNPLGITAVPLVKVEGLNIHIGNCDLVDGTPVLDIKPYIATVDAFPDASRGWLAEVDAAHAAPPRYEVTFSPLAITQLEWLQRSFEVNFIERAIELLSRDPAVHRTRRITRLPHGMFRMGAGAWRIIFAVKGEVVEIAQIAPGYPRRLLEADPLSRVPDREAQIAFLERWPE